MCFADFLLSCDGCDILVSDKKGNSVLHFACSCGSEDMAMKLLRSQALDKLGHVAAKEFIEAKDAKGQR